ncbi:uncharacterized protein SPAPADRAFT_138815 [Spathaspora passalidarum NRRL Y-27907]|uniref:Mitochondrial 15S rRNA processing factor CCM1 n=1 Tax=Spathaspora passalidarum (strain NRRL Y-27907 / 11-Y1) TaxID=619300 RepID=G3ANH1_SPAPN|nr:uncharacterized protein SPAPADRAFT_138815 [Spathaspora passalidarum NRRL Y-27907]EGW31960.1 hypothetical protein SPAPADRAFT_138815 [Spathaspora passalidarum NRRL Y-27907]
MIPLRQSVSRTISRGSLYKLRHIPVILSRFQSTAGASSAVKVPQQTIKPEEVLKKTKNTKARVPKHINAKLKDITTQIGETISKALPVDLRESYEILEEGITYVREIQIEEGMSEREVYQTFSPLATDLFRKALKPEAFLGKNKTIEDLFNMLVEQRIANHTHFIDMATRHIKGIESSENRLKVYEKIIKLWVNFLEYSQVKQPLRIRVSGNEDEAKIYDFSNLVVYCYVQSCLEQEVSFTTEHITKLIQQNKAPKKYRVRQSLENLQVFKEAEYKKFRIAIVAQNVREFNPDDPKIFHLLNDAMRAKDSKKVWDIYHDIQQSCAKYDKQVSRATLEKIMYAFQQTDRPDDVFEIFQAMLNRGVIPTANGWSIILTTLASPEKIAANGRETSLENFERVIATIQSSKINMTPALFSSIISGFANFDCPEKIDQYLAQYSGISLTNYGKDGILVGMVLNGKIDQANAKLDEYLKDGSGYIPGSTAINVFLTHYVKEKNYKAVEGIVEFMRKNKVVETHAITSTLIDCYCKRQFDKGLDPDIDVVVDLVKKAKSVEFNMFALTSMVDTLSKTNITVARSIYNHAMQNDPKNYALHTSMIKNELSFGELGKAEHIFEYVIQNVKADARLYNLMINGSLHRDAKLAFEFYEKMKEQDVSPNAFTFYFLLNHAKRTGNNVLIEKLIKDLAEAKLRTLGTSLPKMILSLNGKYEVPASLLAQAQSELHS